MGPRPTSSHNVAVAQIALLALALSCAFSASARPVSKPRISAKCLRQAFKILPDGRVEANEAELSQSFLSFVQQQQAMWRREQAEMEEKISQLKQEIGQLKSIKSKKASEQSYIAICLAVKDQNRDIAEWLDHHKRIGVGKVYLYDNNSKNPMIKSVYPFVDSGFVDYHFMAQNISHPQMWMYNTCLNDHRHKHRWIAFIDADEFMIPKGQVTRLGSWLKEYEEFGGVALNWQMFGSSGHKTRPTEGTMRSYTKCVARDNYHNHHVKTIANTRFVMMMAGPHHAKYHGDKYAVNENRERVDGAFSKSVAVAKWGLHHYVIKSLEEYSAKMARGSAMGNFKTIQFFNMIDSKANHTCTEALPWADKVPRGYLS